MTWRVIVNGNLAYTAAITCPISWLNRVVLQVILRSVLGWILSLMLSRAKRLLLSLRVLSIGSMRNWCPLSHLGIVYERLTVSFLSGISRNIQLDYYLFRLLVERASALLFLGETLVYRVVLLFQSIAWILSLVLDLLSIVLYRSLTLGISTGSLIYEGFLFLSFSFLDHLIIIDLLNSRA